jgi:spore germination protein KC
MQKNNAFYIKILAMISILNLLVTGCSITREPEDFAYALLIGIDHGAENIYRISYLISNPRQLAPGGGSDGGTGREEASIVVTLESPSIYASMNMVNSFVGKRITLMHAKGLIFSESMARDGLMSQLVAAMMQFREMRGTAFLVVSKESPQNVLENIKTPLESNPAKYIELLAASSVYTGFFPNVQIQEFYNNLKAEGINNICALGNPSDEKLPPHSGQGKQGNYKSEGGYTAGEMDKKGGPPLEAMGAAVFDNTKMVGELNGDETKICSMFRGKFNNSIFSFIDPIDHKSIRCRSMQRESLQLPCK